jgi:endonuclease/exonuclease/phosphatase family metal-dependent hydrolase
MATFRGFKACACLIAWLPVYEAELQRRKILKSGQKLKIYQLIGGAPASGGTHSKGGAFDLLDLPGKGDLEVARQMGADATWSRKKNWDGRGGMAHIHGVLRGCPHNLPARYQITSTTQGVDHGRNGLANRGKDDGPRPLSYRTWSQGITWAKKQGQPEAVLRPMQFNLPGPDKMANPTARIARAAHIVAAAKPHLIGWNELVGTPKPGFASAFASSVDKALGARWLLVRPTKPLNENYISYDGTVLQLVEQYDDTILPSKSGGRHLTRAVFKHKATGKVFAVGQTHLVSAAGSQGERDRQTQAKAALASMKAVSAKHGQCPFIIQGDPNTPAVLTALANAGMKNTRQFADVSGNRNATTYTNKAKTKPSTDVAWIIDQQYVTAGMYVVGYTVHQDLDAKGNFIQPRPSDHQPIISSVRF